VESIVDSPPAAAVDRASSGDAQGEGSMFYTVAVVASLAAVLLTGAMAGLFAAFSVSIMPAFDAIAPRAAIAAMTAINRRIQTPLFFLGFFGAPLASLAAGAAFAALEASLPAAAMFAACAIYSLGSLAPTVGVHVPLNRKLERAAEPADENAAGVLWREYSYAWTRANHVRASFAAVSLLFCALALFWRGWSEAMLF
jgi:uncharacterized membrane protein